ncbi:MAG: hypothetical protein ACE5JM_00295 [Armatimonadota bacterium]
MEVVTYWSGIVVGVLGSLYGFAVVAGAWRSPTEPPEGAEGARLPAPWFIGAAGALVLIPFLLTIPAAPSPPFGEGMGLGIGLLIGGAFALVAAVATPFARDARLRERGRAWVVAVSAHIGLASWALLGANLTVLIFRTNPTGALVGFGLGCCIVGLVMRLGGDVLSSRSPAPLSAERWRGLEAFVVFAVTLAAAVYIAVHHFTQTEQRIWWALPLLLAAIGIAVAIVGSRFADVVAGRRAGLATGIAVALTAALLTMLAHALSLKVFAPRTTFWAVLCGLGAAVAIIWLLAAVRTAPGGAGRTLVAGSVQAACVAAALIVLAEVVCFKLLAGYGVGLALVAAWPLALVAAALIPSTGEEDDTASSETSAPGLAVGLVPCLTIGLLMLLIRLFLEANPDAPRLEFGVHYVFVGLMAGVLLPLLFAAFSLRTQEGAARLLDGSGPGAAIRSVLTRTVVVAAFCLIAPLLVLFMWGFKAALGLLAGLVAAQALLTVIYLWQGATAARGADDSGAVLLPGLGIVSLTVSLVAIQFSHVVAPLIVAERIYKVYTVVAILVLGALWLMVDAWRSMRESRPAD